MNVSVEIWEEKGNSVSMELPAKNILRVRGLGTIAGRKGGISAGNEFVSKGYRLLSTVNGDVSGVIYIPQ